MFDEDGRREATYAYDDWGRVKASWHGRDAGKVEVAYPVKPDGTQDDTRAIVTPPVGLPVEYQFDMTHPYRQVSRIVDVAGTIQMTYHPTLHRLAARVDARNVRTEYEYGGDGSRETARTEAVGTPQQRRIETPWNAANGRPEAKRLYADAPGSPRTLLRDVRYRYVPGTARLAGLDKVDPADGRSRSTNYTHCSAADVATPATECGLEGQLRSIDGPRTDVADVTSYAYYVADNLAGCGTQAGPCHHRGDLKRVTNALGHPFDVLAYDRAGRAVRVRDPNGTLIDYAYHARGWLTSRTLRANAAGTPDAADATTTFEHDGSGNVTRVNFPDGGNALVYGYDDAHRLESITDAAGNILSYTLDSAGNRVNEHRSDTTSDMSWNISREYDMLNRLIYEFDAISRPTLRMEYDDAATGVRNGYDANGNPRRTIDVRGTQTDHQYDALNRLVRTLHDFGGNSAGANAQTRYDYDARGHLVGVLDADNVATGYFYDGLDDLRSETGTDAGNRTYEYDLGGNRIRATDARPMTVTHVFDALNRRVGTYTPSGRSDVVRDYDLADKQTLCTGSFAKGRLSRITDSSGTTTYCYDRRGNVVRKMLLPPGEVWLNGTGREIGYAYDRNDRLSETTYPNGAVVSYTRDAGGHVVTITRREHAAAPAVTLVAATRFYPFGPLNSVSFGNGRTLTKTYDTNYTPDTLESTLPGGLVLDYQVDGARNIVAVGTTIDGPPQRRYRYDPLGRLDRVQDANNATVEEYTYSQGGDRTSKRIGAQPLQSYGYAPGSHRLANVSSWVRQYDATGNTTRLPPATNYPLAYDDLGRLSTVTLDGQGAPVDTRYAYNALGQRVSKTTANETVVTDYDEAGSRIVDTAWRTECPDGGSSVRGVAMPPAPSAAYCPDGSPAVSRFLWRTEYVYLEGMPVAIVRYVGNGTAQLSYLETDHLGTPRVAVDAATGAVQWRWDLVSSAFGEHAPTATAGFELNLRYPGQHYDRETGMHYNGFRDYDPTTGRYLQSDPIGLAGGPNRYAYVGSSALNATDPAGLVKIDLFGPAEKEQIYHDAVATYIDKPNECLVFSHGTSQSVFDARAGSTRPRLTTAEQLQQVLLDGGCRKGMKVTLFSCNTGAGTEPVAKTLAEGEDKIFTDVTAPNKTLWYNRADGLSGPNMIFGKNPDGTMNTNDPGEFVNFRQ